MCFLGLLGVILMIIANELNFAHIHQSDSVPAWFIKLFITISTAALIGLIMYYHRLDLELYCTQNALSDWRVGLTEKKMALIILEIIICAVHSMPRIYPKSDDSDILSDNIGAHPLSFTKIDVGLGLPSEFNVEECFCRMKKMPTHTVVVLFKVFLRLYLVGRTILFHSRLVHDASLQSLGYLNRVSIDFFFLMKTFLEQWPIRSLCIFCTAIFLIGSWCLRACNYTPQSDHLPIGDAMWLFIVTFCTIGMLIVCNE
jgi:hypothetical protein